MAFVFYIAAAPLVLIMATGIYNFFDMFIW